VSCMSCHVSGILPKADQMIDHLGKNPKAFTRAEADVIKALYPGKDAVLKLMPEHFLPECPRLQLLLGSHPVDSRSQQVGVVLKKIDIVLLEFP